MIILITGATGFIAKNIVKTLANKVEFILVTRNVKLAQKLYKDIHGIYITSSLTKDMPTPDVVINLAGSSILKSSFAFHSNAELKFSRVDYTTNLCNTLKALNKFPKIFINASASAIYGANEYLVSEKSDKLGGNYLANITMSWENSVYEGCKGTTARVVLMRLGLVLGQDGGFYKKIAPIFKLGVGASIGGGKQYISWISVRDTVRAIIHIINTPEIKGPVNFVAPVSNTQYDIAKSLAKSFHRKLIFNIPAFIIKITQNKMAPVFLDSLAMSPTKLLNTGFLFKDVDLNELIKSFAKKHH